MTKYVLAVDDLSVITAFSSPSLIDAWGLHNIIVGLNNYILLYHIELLFTLTNGPPALLDRSTMCGFPPRLYHTTTPRANLAAAGSLSLLSTRTFYLYLPTMYFQSYDSTMFETPTAKNCLTFCTGVSHLRLYELEVRSDVHPYTTATTDLAQAAPRHRWNHILLPLPTKTTFLKCSN